MANPSKQKGTTEETAICRKYHSEGYDADRMAAGWYYDVEVPGPFGPVEILSTRGDRGERMYTLRETDFIDLWKGAAERPKLHIEAKRRKSFAIHTTFNQKFRRKLR